MGKSWDTARRWAWRILKVAVVVAVIAGVIYGVRFAPVSVTQHQELVSPQYEQSDDLVRRMHGGTACR